MGGERLTKGFAGTTLALSDVIGAMFWSVEARLDCDRHIPAGCRLLAVPLSGPQRQLIVPRRKPGRVHDELSELICNRSIKGLAIAQ